MRMLRRKLRKVMRMNKKLVSREKKRIRKMLKEQEDNGNIENIDANNNEDDNIVIDFESVVFDTKLNIKEIPMYENLISNDIKENEEKQSEIKKIQVKDIMMTEDKIVDGETENIQNLEVEIAKKNSIPEIIAEQISTFIAPFSMGLKADQNDNKYHLEKDMFDKVLKEITCNKKKDLKKIKRRSKGLKKKLIIIMRI